MKSFIQYLVTALFFLCTLYSSADIYSQEKKIEFGHFSYEQGYSPSSVFAILQDSRGFLWFGTTDGLMRYDGYNFKIFKHNPFDTHSISHNVVISIYEDKSGMLWIGTEGGGLNRYDRESNEFTVYIHDENDPNSISNNTIVSVLEDRSGNFWLGTNGGGLNKLTRTDNEEFPGTFIHFMNNPEENTSLSSNFVFSIFEDKFGVLWIGTENGLNELIPSNIKKTAPVFIRHRNNPADPASLSHNTITSIYEDKAGVLWIGTHGGGVNKLVSGDQAEPRRSFVHYFHDPNDPTSLSSNEVRSISEDNSGNLWIGTLGGGLNKFDRVNEEFTRYTYDPDDPESLKGNWVYSIYKDNSGIIWIGTMPGGINKLDPMKNQFKHYQNNLVIPESLGSDRVFSICEDNSGNLWIGTYGGGIYKIPPTENGNSSTSIIHYTHNPNDPNSLSNNSVFSICEDNSKNLWFGTFGGGLDKIVWSDVKKSHPKFIHYQHNPGDSNSLSSDEIRSIYEDDSGNLWIGTEGGGLNKLMQEKGEYSPPRIIQYIHNPHDPTSISNNIIFSIHEDRKGILWIGTSGGLNKFIPPDTENSLTTFKHYTHDSNNPESLSNNEVTAIYEDQSGNLWIGTASGGLNKFDRKSEKFFRFTEEDGLPNNGISGILEDRNGNLWLSTRKGLSKFNPETGVIRNYIKKDGLQNNEFQQGAGFKSKRGEMFFGGANGLDRFYPDRIKENNHIPPVVITDFQLLNNSVPVGLDTSSNRTILKKSITETTEIELSYDDYIISFEFAALDFHTPEKNKYAYTLEGFEKRWNYTDANRRYATYTNLDPGEYFFRVKGSNNDGFWNEAGASIKIVIPPPWWATWWAYFCYIVLAISTLYGLRRYELNRINWRNQFILEEIKLKERTEIDRMKSRFFANISHEFRTPLTLILGPIEKIKPNITAEEIQKQTNLVKRNAYRLLNLVNQLLDLSKLEAGKLRLKAAEENMVPFLKGIVMSFESIAEQKDISLKVKTTNDDIQLYFDRDKMSKILTNLLSNAFKFTPSGGEITVSINQTEQNSVEIKIRDTGIGISADELPKLFDRFYQVDSSFTKEHQGTGIGLALTKELVEFHHGSIRVESQERDSGLIGTGWTEFTIELPRGREHLKDDEILEKQTVAESFTSAEEKDFIQIEYPIPAEKELSQVEGARTAEDSELVKIGEEEKIMILVVEDNPDVKEYIKDSLGDDFQIEIASNGQQGVLKAEKLIPDLIISDIMMPKMDGNELTRILKNDEKTSHIPIVLLTAKSEQESRLEGLETGADDYLTKPFDIKELQIRIKNLINIRKKLQEKYGRGEYIPITDGKKLSNLEERFMDKITEIIENHLSEEEFSIEQFAKEVFMSRMQLHRKLKALTGKPASLYVRSFRLLRAKKMLEEKLGNISEIAYSVGFSSPAYFSKCFRDEFGIPPSELSS